MIRESGEKTKIHIRNCVFWQPGLSILGSRSRRLGYTRESLCTTQRIGEIPIVVLCMTWNLGKQQIQFCKCYSTRLVFFRDSNPRNLFLAIVYESSMIFIGEHAVLRNRFFAFWCRGDEIYRQKRNSVLSFRLWHPILLEREKKRVAR